MWGGERKTRPPGGRDPPRGVGGLDPRGWGRLTRPLPSAQPPSPPALHHAFTALGGGGSEGASFPLSSLPAPGLGESCAASNGILTSGLRLPLHGFGGGEAGGRHTDTRRQTHTYTHTQTHTHCSAAGARGGGFLQDPRHNGPRGAPRRGIGEEKPGAFIAGRASGNVLAENHGARSRPRRGGVCAARTPKAHLAAAPRAARGSKVSKPP